MTRVFRFLGIITFLLFSRLSFSADASNPLAEPEKFHVLLVFSDPPLSNIYLNGKIQDVRTPAVLRIPASAQPTLELKSPGYKTHQQKISVTSSGKRISVELEPKSQ